MYHQYLCMTTKESIIKCLNAILFVSAGAVIGADLVESTWTAHLSRTCSIKVKGDKHCSRGHKPKGKSS